MKEKATLAKKQNPGFERTLLRMLGLQGVHRLWKSLLQVQETHLQWETEPEMRQNDA
jgi:hypothetical protein